MSKTLPQTVNKRHLILAIIGAVIILSAILFIRFSYDDIFNPPPEGVGEIGSEHIHAKLGIYVGEQWVDMDFPRNPQYLKKNDYIYFDETPRNIIHRTATGATFGMFLESIGMQFTDNCFILPDVTLDSTGTLFTQTEFCNTDYQDGRDNMTIKFFVRCEGCKTGHLTEDPNNHIFQDGEGLLIVYDDIDRTTRNYG